MRLGDLDALKERLRDDLSDRADWWFWSYVVNEVIDAMPSPMCDTCRHACDRAVCINECGIVLKLGIKFCSRWEARDD